MAIALPIPAPAVIVSSLAHLDDVARATGAGHLVTCLYERKLEAPPGSILPGRHLTLAMEDIEAPRQGYVEPNAGHVAELIAFLGSWDQASPLLIHCHAGISRSTAAAFICVCALNPAASERHIAAELRTRSPKAWPNRLLIALADDALHRRGRMISAIDAIGPGSIAGDNTPFALPALVD